MVAWSNTEIPMKNKQSSVLCRCAICGKRMKFSRIREFPLVCWSCIVIDDAGS